MRHVDCLSAWGDIWGGWWNGNNGLRIEYKRRRCSTFRCCSIWRRARFCHQQLRKTRFQHIMDGIVEKTKIKLHNRSRSPCSGVEVLSYDHSSTPQDLETSPHNSSVLNGRHHQQVTVPEKWEMSWKSPTKKVCTCPRHWLLPTPNFSGKGKKI